jgi:hypothetical protein
VGGIINKSKEDDDDDDDNGNDDDEGHQKHCSNEKKVRE